MSQTNDIEYYFVSASRGEAGIRTIADGILPRTRPLTNHWIGPFLVQRGLFSALRHIRPDAIIFVGDYRYLTTWVNAALHRATGTRIFFWTQGWRRAETGVRAWVRKTFYRLAHHLFVYGERSRRLGTAAGFRPERITVIGNSLVSAADLNTTPTHRTADVELRIGAVMRLSPNKKAVQLAEIAAALIARGIPTRVHVAGEGPDLEPLVAACAASSVSLRTYGSIHGAEDLADFYADLDVCVIPGAAGLSLIQAMAHGRPAVTNDTQDTQGPEVAAVLPGSTGDLVDEDDIPGFASAIARWRDELHAPGNAVAQTCVAEVADQWIAERQADLIAQRIREAAGVA